jgi:hypothetical protein
MDVIDFEHNQKKAFLTAIAEVPQEYAAARIAKVPIALVRGWYDSDPDFNLACTEAKEHLLDTIEAKAFELALGGNDHMIRFVLERQRDSFSPHKREEDKGPIKHRIRDFSGKYVGEEDVHDEQIVEGEHGEETSA